MLIKCIADTGRDLSEKTIESGQKKSTVYPLSIEALYVVYGISVWRGAIYYLVDDSDWYPAELFEIINHLLPLEWYFSFRSNWYFDFEKMKKCEIKEAVWGYKELVFDINHQTKLIEGDLAARDIFLKRKKEIDEYEELSKYICKKIE